MRTPMRCLHAVQELRLPKLKLAGFESFVDPISASLSGQLLQRQQLQWLLRKREAETSG